MSAASPLRIAELTATFPPYLGGAGTVCFHLSRELAAHGHQVEVFTAASPGEAEDPPGVLVHRREPWFAIGNAPLLPELGRLRGFDAIHLHYPFIFGAELALMSRLRTRVPVVLSYHNMLVGEGGRRALFAGYELTVGRALARAADRVLVVSDAHAATVPYLQTLRSRHPERLGVLANGVDIELFAPGPDATDLRGRLGIPAGAPVAAFVATLDRAHFLKRTDLAIDVAAGIPGLHLVLAGDGEWRSLYEEQARSAGIEDRVHFLGPVDHSVLPDVLRAADLALLTSDRESFGIVLIEAMACGLPTVSTNPDGVMAVVRAGETGLVAPIGDVDALQAAVRELIELGPDGRARMGAAGRSECEARYAWPRLGSRLDEIIREAVTRRRGRTKR